MTPVKETLKGINWLALITGIFMIALIFAGPWWQVTAGDRAMEMAISPFEFNATLAGQSLRSTLTELFLLASKISFLLGGIFLIMSSLSPKSWWTKYLMKFGVMKPFWSVIMLVIMVVAGTVLMNNVVPGFLSSAVGQATGQQSQAQTIINLPYFSGSTQATLALGGQATISTQITLGLTWAFWFAVVTAGLGIATRIFSRRYPRYAPSK